MDYATISLRLKTNLANTLNKTVEELVPWVDYDPIVMDNACWRYIRESQNQYNNWTGD